MRCDRYRCPVSIVFYPLGPDERLLDARQALRDAGMHASWSLMGRNGSMGALGTGFPKVVHQGAVDER